MDKTKRFALIAVLISLGLTGLIVLIEPLVSDVPLAVDSGARHYYWQLTTRNNLNMMIVWALFGTQLIGNVFLVRRRLNDSQRGLTNKNIDIFLFNLMMILIHYIQSIISYDGLAQDVSVFSSQYSVILMLVTILLIEIPRRGIIFGRKIKIDKRAMSVLYAVHGFVFMAAIIYTFWFHPVINTIGHLFGFFYMFLLFTQISLVKTNVHTNSRWIVGLEVLVAFHGATVAYYVQNSELWAMFLFGFGFIFVFTQIYGLRINKSIINLIQVLYILIAVNYYWATDIANVHQILWIPVVEYAHVIIMLAIIYLVLKIKDRKNPKMCKKNAKNQI